MTWKAQVKQRERAGLHTTALSTEPTLSALRIVLVVPNNGRGIIKMVLYDTRIPYTVLTPLFPAVFEHMLLDAVDF